MMIEPIKLACSEQLTRALRALEDGHDVRLSSWPPAVYLRKQAEQVAMYHDERLSSPSWSGPSTEEASAFDWIVIQNQHSA